MGVRLINIMDYSELEMAESLLLVKKMDLI